MKDKVIIKSFPNGITLHMDEETDFDDILKSLPLNFLRPEIFIGTASVALSMEGRGAFAGPGDSRAGDHKEIQQRQCGLHCREVTRPPTKSLSRPFSMWKKS